MKLPEIRSIALVLALLPCIALAGEISLKSDAPACDSPIPPDKAAIVTAARTDGVVTLEVTAQLNCAYTPGKPDLRVWRDSATVTLSTKSPSGAAAACLCTHKLSFEIKDLYDGARTIYYVQDGTVLGHASAP